MGEFKGKAWEHFCHEADVGVRGYGSTVAEAFEHAALAMMAVIVDPGTVGTREMVAFTVKAADREILLTEWLNELIYEMATHKMLFGRFQVEIVDDELRGKAWGEPIDIGRHCPAVEVKGATFTELAVRQQGEGLWLAQCVVDV